MILLDSNIKNIGDVKFTCVPFGNYEIPFFAEHACIPDVVLSSENIHFRSSRERYYVFVKLHSSVIAGSMRISFYGKDGWPIGSSKALTVLSVAGGFTTYYASIPHYTESLANAISEIRLANNFSNTLAKSPIKLVPSKQWDKYLTFNYYNLSGDTLGFPFNQFKTMHQVDTGTQNMGLTYTVEGGVQIGATRYGVDETGFRDQRYNPHTLSANTNRLMTLTIGGAKGVPEYVGEMVNNILACDTVFLNGKRIARAEGSVPEPILIAKGYPYVNYSVDVEVIPTEPNVFNITSLLGLD